MLAKNLQAISSSGASLYVEDVFSTWLYAGTSSAQTITNGIDLSSKGGMVWIKERNTSASPNNIVFDTSRGTGTALYANLTNANSGDGTVSAFNSNGYGDGAAWGTSTNLVSWTFRKAPRFFDVVSYTGNGANRVIAHNLGSVPGCIIIKRTDNTADWQVYHRNLSNTEYLVLNSTAGKATGTSHWNSTTPTSNGFSLGTHPSVNANTGTYVAYLFAHDAGGFGPNKTDNIISCGSYTGDGTYPSSLITLGWEPQWVLVRKASNTDNWNIYDIARGMSLTSYGVIAANTANTETYSSASSAIAPRATGFTVEGSALNASGETYLYVAIRRGPMKTPTAATQVLTIQARAGDSTVNTISTGFPPDFWFTKCRSNGGAGYKWASGNRLTELSRHLAFNTSDPEVNYGTPLQGSNQNTVSYGDAGASNKSIDETSAPYLDVWFKRAPGFLDVVAYTGTGTALTVAHNLGIVPEMIIVKRRSDISDWVTYVSSQGNNANLALNRNDAVVTPSSQWNTTTPTASVFSVGASVATNISGSTYIAYLFASCPGVSKVGTYAGTGSQISVDCGFTSGARFLLIKRSDAIAPWYLFDSIRGIVAANDPYLLLNSNNGEVIAGDYVDPSSSGFIIPSTAPADLNASGGTYVYLAVA